MDGGTQVKEAQANTNTKTGTPYGTGIQAQRTKYHKGTAYKSYPFYLAVVEHCGTGNMAIFKRMAKVLKSKDVRINRDAKRCKQWLIDELSKHIPIESIGDYLDK